MRFTAIGLGIVGVVLASGVAVATPQPASPADIEAVLKSLEAPYATEAPRLVQDSENGYIRYLGAPPGGRFVAPAMTKTSDPSSNAVDFVTRYKSAFLAADGQAQIVVERQSNVADRHYVRLKQTYGGIEVFGSGITVQLNDDGGIVSVISDVMQGVTQGQTDLSLTPAIGSAVAQQFAIQRVRTEVEEAKTVTLVASQPVLKVYDPSVIGQSGITRLVYYTEISSPDSIGIRRAVLVDANTGQIPLHWNLIHTAKNRQIYDGGSWYLLDGTLARSEGEPDTGIKDVDDAYNYLGDTYDFYAEHHGRDALDGAGGMMIAFVRARDFGGLAFPNAFWDGVEMVFGHGYTVDDVTAHELTHGVTEFSSNLIYLFESGAINESFSDMWGEWIDLSNSGGTDTDEVRWLMGEDLPGSGALRNMQDPTEFGDPDRYSEYLNYPDYYDNGGVHFNSGIGNKLCYLLTDGDSFNGQTVEGMGIARTADLMYEAQTNLLVPSADYYDFYAALSQAAINLEFTFAERLNLRSALAAVEIIPPGFQSALENFRATPAYSSEGVPVNVLTWKNPQSDATTTATIVRSSKRFIDLVPDSESQNDENGIVVFEGEASEFVDGVELPVAQGQDYFYSLFIDVEGGLPFAEFVRATAGNNPPDFMTEVFTEGFDGAAPNPVDLSFSQILFTPIADVSAARESGKIGDYYNFSNYVATVNQNVRSLPVAKNDADGQATFLPMGDDDYITYTFGSFAFPFFGVPYRQASVASNGYIAFQPLSVSSSSNFPSLESHLDFPRISFLFADLAPNVGGTIWGRSLDDRLVITFERVPEYTVFSDGVAPGPNTAQVELFFSGHIRVTYLELNLDEVVVGLSDGDGVFPDLDTLLPGTPSTVEQTDFSKAAPLFSEVLDIWPPIPLQIVDEGEIVNFDIRTVSPAGTVPSLTASWDRDDLVPFADNFDGTGTFTWQTGFQDGGLQSVEILATTDTESASQAVSILVLEETAPPEARNLQLITSEPGEDPTTSRPVSSQLALTASYDYFHPEATRDPMVYGEGRSLIYWFRNGVLVPSLTNSMQVSPGITHPGDRWHFTVTPETEFFVLGETYTSPVVTIVDLPIIDDVSPISGPMVGGTEVTIRGYNLDGPMAVRFGGFDAQSITAISADEIMAVSPVHAPGTVDIEVDTPDGTARMASAFTYGESDGDIVKADINGDGSVTAVDVQLVINGVLGTEKNYDVDANRDGQVNAADIQVVVNALLNK